ncbi:MAG: HEAT repeat domain-containing protein, partial [Nannocystaceae bacterium]
LNLGDLPPPAAHGPLLRACIELGEAMVPHILELFDHRRYLVRFYAAFVFQDLRDGRCIRPLSELAFDQEASVRLIAMRVLETYTQEEDFERVVARIRKSLNSVDRPRRIQAIDALGTLRDIRSIPQLIDLLEATDTEVQDTALGALCSITAQQLGYRASRWRTWYADHSDRSRIDWLIEGLRHRDPAVRRWVADELARISNQDIDFPANGDRRDREQAIKAWSAWWAQAQEAG